MNIRGPEGIELENIPVCHCDGLSHSNDNVRLRSSPGTGPSGQYAFQSSSSRRLHVARMCHGWRNGRASYTAVFNAFVV